MSGQGESTASVKSPCISVCVLDVNDICEGCFRSALEITDWLIMNDDEKRDVLRRCAKRARESGRMIF